MMAAVTRLTVLRSLGFAATCAVVVCNMIGQGVFLKARVMTCNVGSPVVMIGAWLVAGVLALCGALSIAELSATLPESGGIYAFLRRAYGRAVAFAYGWEALFVGGPAATAALAAGAAIFFNLASSHSLDRFSSSFAFMGTTFTASGLQWAAIASIVIVTAINLAPAFVNGQIAVFFAIVKLAMLVGVTVVAFALGHGSFTHFAASGAGGICGGVSRSARAGLPGFAAALIGALYAYQGWQSGSLIGGEVKDPGRTFPRALTASVLLVIVCYVSANIAFVYVLGPRAIASLPPGASVGVTVIETLFGPIWKLIAAGLLFASVAATLHVTILTNARITYALAQDGLGFGFLGGLSRRARVPVNALVANALIASALVVVGSFDTLADYLVFNAWVFFAATGGAVFILRRREPSLERPYRTFGYPVVPALFVLVALWLLIQTLITNPQNSFIGLAITAASVPYYFWQRRQARRHTG